MLPLVLLQRALDDRQARGGTVELAEVGQGCLPPIQLARQALNVGQACGGGCRRKLWTGMGCGGEGRAHHALNVGQACWSALQRKLGLGAPGTKCWAGLRGP